MNKFFLSLTLFSILFSPSLLSAQKPTSNSQEKAVARHLFSEGVNFADQENWEAAQEKFQKALKLYWAPTIAFNLAKVEAKLKHYVLSSELLREVINHPDSDNTLKKNAKRDLGKISTKISYVEINLQGDLQNIKLLIDQNEKPLVLIGTQIPLDPGNHSVKITRNNETLHERVFEIQETELKKLNLFITPSTQNLAKNSLSQDKNILEEDDSSNTLIWAGAGTLLVATVTGALLYFLLKPTPSKGNGFNPSEAKITLIDIQ